MKNLNSWIFGICVALILGGLLFSDLLLAKVKIAPTELFSNGLPANINALTSFKAQGGKVFEYFDTIALQKYSIVVADFNGNGEAPSGQEVITKLVERQAKDKKLELPQLGELTISFISAQFDPARAYDFAADSVTIDGQKTNASRFITNKGANYFLALRNIGQKQISVLMLKKEQPVDVAAAERFLAMIKFN